jgi:hypothetical protein
MTPFLIWAVATGIGGVWAIKLVRSPLTKEVLIGAFALTLQGGMLFLLLALASR